VNYQTETLTFGNERQAYNVHQSLNQHAKSRPTINLKIKQIQKTLPYQHHRHSFCAFPSRKKSKSPTNSTTSPTNYKDASPKFSIGDYQSHPMKS
jgi:hypothetical protein